MHHLIAQRLGMMLMEQAGGDGSGSGSGSSGAQPPIEETPEFKAALDKEVERVTQGLKNNRDSFQTQLAAAKDRLAKFGDADPDMVNSILQRFESEEEKELLRKGDIDSIVNRRVDKMQAKFQKEAADRDQVLQTSLNRQKKLEGQAIAAEITRAATEAGADPRALTDFVRRAQGTFALSEEGDVIAVDSNGEPLYDVDGKTPLSAKAWALSLQADAPHLFTKPSSGGSQGGQGARNVGKVNGTPAEREAYFKNLYNLN